MPYASNDELPTAIRSALGHLPHALEIWRKAYNSADEGAAQEPAAVAWAAVKHKYEKGADGKWRAKEAAMTETTTLRGVELFMPGQWNGQPWTEHDVDEILANYAEQGFRAPIKIGHKSPDLTDGAPALGWIENLRKVGTKLVGDIMQMPAKLVELVRAGRFDRISPEIFLKYERNGKTLGKVLKAVSLLGANIPAIPDLAPLRDLVYSEETAEADVAIPAMAFTFNGEGDALQLELVGEPLRGELQTFAVTDRAWDGDKRRFSLEQLERAVPRAVAAAARKRAQQEGREVSKDDLNLPYREPDGTINANGVRAALQAIGGARTGQQPDVPDDVLAAAREELTRVLADIKSRAMSLVTSLKEEPTVAEPIKLTEEQLKEISSQVETKFKADLDSKDAQIRALKQRDEAREQEVSALKRRAFQDERTAFITNAKREGRVTPAMEPLLLALFEKVNDGEQVTVVFQKAGEKTPGEHKFSGVELVEEIVGTLPIQVDMHERTRRPTASQTAFADPMSELEKRITAYFADHPTLARSKDYETVFNIVLDADPKLKAAYIAS